MRDQTVDGYLRQLAARTAAPSGGTVAALSAAQGAALIAMVARFSDGASDRAATSENITTGAVASAADAIIAESLALADADEAAYGLVMQAYRMPRQSPQEKAARSAAIARALLGAARPPADLLAASRRLIGLAEDLLPAANRNLLGDLLAAAASVRAAAEISRANIEANVPRLSTNAGPAGQPDLAAALAGAASVIARADRLTAGIRGLVGQGPAAAP